MNVNQVAHANNIADANKIYAGNKIALPGANPQLNFNGSMLYVYDKSYNTTVPSLSWGAVSGGTIFNYPPISQGNWRTVDPGEIQSWDRLSPDDKIESTIGSFTKYVGLKFGTFSGGMGTWGSQRTELHNLDTHEYYTGFYIHGGDTPGSAGCIDLTGQNDSFHEFFRNYGQSIDLRVQY